MCRREGTKRQANHDKFIPGCGAVSSCIDDHKCAGRIAHQRMRRVSGSIEYNHKNIGCGDWRTKVGCGNGRGRAQAIICIRRCRCPWFDPIRAGAIERNIDERAVPGHRAVVIKIDRKRHICPKHGCGWGTDRDICDVSRGRHGYRICRARGYTLNGVDGEQRTEKNKNKGKLKSMFQCVHPIGFIQLHSFPPTTTVWQGFQYNKNSETDHGRFRCWLIASAKTHGNPIPLSLFYGVLVLWSTAFANKK